LRVVVMMMMMWLAEEAKRQLRPSAVGATAD
jgi:hypothetical protein